MPITYDRDSVFASVRDSVFAGHLTDGQVEGIDSILAGWETLQPAGDTRHLADCLGTTKWETASTMQPIEEYGHGRGRAYGVPAGPWHQVYDGRGDVQLTWEANYRKATLRLRARGVLRADEDLERTPALAMRADIAAAIMFCGMLEGWFTGKKLSTYYTASAADWVGSRRIINGTDHAAPIALLKKHFYAALVPARRQSGTTKVMLPTASSAVGAVPAAAAAKAGVPVPPPAPPHPGVFAELAFFFGRH